MNYIFLRRLLGLPVGHQFTLDGEECGHAVIAVYGDGTYYGSGAGGGYKMDPDGALVFSSVFGDGDIIGDGDGSGFGDPYE